MTCKLVAVDEVEARGASLYLRHDRRLHDPFCQTADILADQTLGRDPPRKTRAAFRWARNIRSVMLRERANRRGGSRNTVKG